MSTPQRSSLYRKEALAHQRERAWGELVIVPPRPARWLTWLALCLALLFIVFLTTAEYTRKARAIAILAYENDPLLLAATEPGTVQGLYVAAGDQVQAGQKIATISTERYAGGEAVYASSARDLSARRTAINSERQQVNALLQAQRNQAQARLQAMTGESQQMEREIAAQQERVSLLQQQVQRFRTLAGNKFLPEQQVQQKQDELAEQLVALETLKRNRSTLEREMASVRTELPALQAGSEAKLAQLSRDEAALTQTAREGLARQSYDITARQTGTIERVIATAGQTLAAGSPLVQMQTGDRRLLADVYVPTRAAGFLKTGQAVRLAVDAFPQERFGHVTATVHDISRSVLSPGDSGLPGIIREPVFKIRAQLDSDQVKAYGNSYPLRSGLMAQADIALDNRPLYLWIIEPILRLKGSL